jgi:hypothetical protein
MRTLPVLRLWTEYGLLALAITLPWVVPGFILTMDLVFTPHISFPQEITNTYILQIILWMAHFVLPSDVIEKVVLLLILLLSGVGMHRVIAALKIPQFTKEQIQWGAYFAGIFYMFNPFIYARFMTGQWMILLGYALLPFFVHALLKLIEMPSRKTAAMLAIWSFVIISVSLHYSGIMAVLLASAAITVFIYKRENRKEIYSWGGASIVAVAIVSCYWIIPSLLGSTGAALGQFDHSHFEAFRTNGQGMIGAFGEVVRLQGFWAESLQLFVLPKKIVPAWGLLWLIVWIVVGIGVKTLWLSAKVLFLLIGIGGVTAIVFAVTPLLEWLAEFLPFVAGYREPHKFINIVVFAFALFGAIGVMRIVKKWRHNSVITVSVAPLLLLLPIIITPTMLWGFAGQLQPRAYPSDWASMDKYIMQHTNGDILFLPWQEYTSFQFAGRIIANPAEKYFNASIIAGDNPSFKHISPTIPNGRKQAITDLLKKKDIKGLQKLRLSHILLAKGTPDYHTYSYLFKNKSVQYIHETENLVLWRLKKEVQ